MSTRSAEWKGQLAGPVSRRFSGANGRSKWASFRVPFLKSAAMLLALFWMLVFRLSQAVERLPEFVYVNF
jgi:hypothetical protein